MGINTADTTRRPDLMLFILSFASLLHLILISIGRFLATKYNFRYMTILEKSKNLLKITLLACDIDNARIAKFINGIVKQT